MIWHLSFLTSRAREMTLTVRYSLCEVLICHWFMVGDVCCFFKGILS